MSRDRIIGFLFLISFIVGYDWVFQYPRRNSLLQAQKQAKASLKTNLFDVEDARDKSPKIESEIKVGEASLTLMLEKFPNRYQIGRMMDVLTNAMPPGFQSRSVTPKFGKPTKRQVELVKGSGLVTIEVEEVEIRVDFTADFRSFGRFLEEIERASVFFKVSGLQLTNRKGEEGLTGYLTLKTYMVGVS
jgi:hypothetical protein